MRLLRLFESMSTREFPPRTIIEAIRNEASPRLLISECLTNPSTLDAALQAAQVHPNGFYKCKLKSSRNGYALRLHLWKPASLRSPATQLSNIHNHRWDFASYVLEGHYVHETFVRDPAGEKYFHHTYSDEQAQAKLVQNDTNQALLLLSAHEQARDSMNFVSSETLHRVIPSCDETTATLFVTGCSVSSETQVFSKRPLAGDPSAFWTKPSATQVQLLRETLATFTV